MANERTEYDPHYYPDPDEQQMLLRARSPRCPHGEYRCDCRLCDYEEDMKRLVEWDAICAAAEQQQEEDERIYQQEIRLR